MRYWIIFGVTTVCVGLAGCHAEDVEDISSDVVCAMDYSAIKATEIVEIDKGGAIYQRFVLEELSEDDLSQQEIESLDRMQEILDSRTRPVDSQDLMILDRADVILSDPSVWNRADDRKCEPQDESFSLFCSLYFGSIDTIGEYRHRRTALQVVRFVIEDATDGRDFEHRLMDFNNLPGTSFGDIKNIIKTARARVQERLDLQAECAL
jgi:hypothetical protein